jgi:hypothetical protein
MAAYRKRPVAVEAVRWFKNGDHPEDYAADTQGFEGGELRTFTGAERRANAWEGSVVRYFRRPDVPGETPCQHCAQTMHVHGWIDTLEGGHIVCPGDWVITGVMGERYPCKPDIFAATYQVDEGESRDYRKERDAAYTERNRVVAALARLVIRLGGRAWLAQHDPADADWDPEWRTLVFIEGASGQMSWHVHDGERELFQFLPIKVAGEFPAWDGHSTPEKYERVARLGR